MKKRLLILTLITLSTVSLTGCDVSQIKDASGNQVIVKLGDGETYTANDLFENYSHTSSGAAEYYTAVYNVLVRYVQPKTNAINNKVEDKMNSFIDSCKSSASTNGTTYKTELSKALSDKGVEELDELQELYYLEEQKSAYEENFYDDNVNDSLLEEYINYYAPYHIRHILVKNSADSSLYKGLITKDDAKNLSDTVARLAKGNETFGTVAKTTASNGDSGSAEIYGDVGIMDTNTSFVSEFKYSVYQYDSFYNDAAKANVTAFNERRASRKIGTTDVAGEALIPVSDEDQQQLKDGLNRIPYDVFEALGKVANDETDTDGFIVKDGKQEYYPRNYLYNKYLNNHNLGVITRGNSTGTRFAHYEGLSASNDTKDDILVDEAGRPILVTKAGTGSGDSGYQGIHLIITQKSPFVNDDSNKSLIEELKSYYDNKVYATSDDVAGTNSYVTYLSADRSTYSERANKIKDLVKGFDSYMNYRIFEQALKTATEKGAKINEDILNLINNYIEANRLTSVYNSNETYADSWKSYMDLLDVEEAVESFKITKEDLVSCNYDANVYSELEDL